MNYKHTQTGWLTLVVCGVLFVFLVVLSAHGPNPQARLIPLYVGVPILLIIMVLFGSLTVTVNDAAVMIQFGPGIIRKKISLADVESCHPVRNQWWWGWGIRLIPGGWLYNVSGLDAVELKMKNGRVFRIGTDEPRRLAEFIQAKLSKVV
jgi:glycerol uptake facilitator-like aquaporin